MMMNTKWNHGQQQLPSGFLKIERIRRLVGLRDLLPAIINGGRIPALQFT